MWNNPACSKCAVARETLELAQVPVSLRPYLQQGPTVAELADVLTRLQLAPWDICRLSEPVATALGLADWPRVEASASQWIDAMVANPVLIQRPIVLLDDGSAIVARDAEALAEVLRRAH